MARTYLFFHPSRLPLAAEELDEVTVTPLPDNAALREALALAFSGIEWSTPHHARAQVGGDWVELLVPQDAADTLSLRGSLRVDHTALIQGLCERFGWLAFDERPYCYQRGREPMPV